MIVSVDSIIKVPIERIVNLKKNMSIRFNDNVIIKNCYFKDIIIFRIFMEIRNGFEFNVTSDMWITAYFKNGLYNKNFHTELYSNILKKIIVPYLAEHNSNEILNRLFKAMLTAVDKGNKYMVMLTLKYVPSLDIMDMMYIQFDKDVINELVAVAKNPTPNRIKESYNILPNVMSKPNFKNNVMALMYLTGVGSVGQINQLFMSRGYITELNNKIFKYPLVNSFLLQFKGSYEFLIETRAGIKALSLSSTTIQKTEYTHREVAILTMIVEGIYRGDCGSKRYTEFYINEDVYENGVVAKRCPLKELVGKYYLDIDNKLKAITMEDKHLIGTTVKLRQATNCLTKNKKHICSTCLGQMADTITPDRNLGNLIMAVLLILMGQGLLSAKHLLNNAVSASIKLHEKAKKIFMIRNGEEVYFKANVVNKKTRDVYIRVLQSEAWGIGNIREIKDIFTININRISKLRNVDLFTVHADGTEEIVNIPLDNSEARAFFTIQFLQHIARTGFTINEDDYYLIRVNDFDVKQPIFKYDNVEYSLATLNAEFKKRIKTQKFVKVDNTIRSVVTPEVLTQQLFDLINSKLSVNIAIIETIVYALTAKDINKGDFDLGRAAADDNVIGFGEAINSRSMAAGMGWDNLAGKMFDPRNYDDTSAVNSKLDVILAPEEVVRRLK